MPQYLLKRQTPRGVGPGSSRNRGGAAHWLLGFEHLLGGVDTARDQVQDRFDDGQDVLQSIPGVVPVQDQQAGHVAVVAMALQRRRERSSGRAGLKFAHHTPPGIPAGPVRLRDAGLTEPVAVVDAHADHMGTAGEPTEPLVTLDRAVELDGSGVLVQRGGGLPSPGRWPSMG